MQSMLEYWTSASSAALYTTPTATHGSLQERAKVRKDKAFFSLCFSCCLFSFQSCSWDSKTGETIGILFSLRSKNHWTHTQQTQLPGKFDRFPVYEFVAVDADAIERATMGTSTTTKL